MAQNSARGMHIIKKTFGKFNIAVKRLRAATAIHSKKLDIPFELSIFNCPQFPRQVSSCPLRAFL